jgi:hypothetical protein
MATPCSQIYCDEKWWGNYVLQHSPPPQPFMEKIIHFNDLKKYQ